MIKKRKGLHLRLQLQGAVCTALCGDGGENQLIEALHYTCCLRMSNEVNHFLKVAKTKNNFHFLQISKFSNLVNLLVENFEFHPNKVDHG